MSLINIQPTAHRGKIKILVLLLSSFTSTETQNKQTGTTDMEIHNSSTWEKNSASKRGLALFRELYTRNLTFKARKRRSLGRFQRFVNKKRNKCLKWQ